MALPKIDSPVYEITLPISKKQLKFRPFLVKEQKNLLMALEADDSDTINSNIKQILINCTVSSKIDIDSLPIVDVEYYFLNLRARSVGEIVEARYRCNAPTGENGDDCGNIMETQVNVLEIEVKQNENVKDVIQLTDTISVKMRYPTFSTIKRAVDAQTETDLALELILDSIEAVCDGEQWYYTKESSHEEVLEFVESLNQTQFKKIESFFEDLPKLDKTVKIKCSKCGFDHTIQYEGLESFFV
jgi:hypothetical protein